jgi:hypothetical protein
MRIPLTLSLADCRLIGCIIAACFTDVVGGAQNAVSSGLDDRGANRQTSAGRP